MGVYINGMEMPTDCIFCPMFHGAWTMCGLLNKTLSPKGRPSDCPLVPVPKHGRLIDADALMLKILDYIDEYSDVDEKGWHNLKWCAMKETEMAINDAPTIIEAEEEKK